MWRGGVESRVGWEEGEVVVEHVEMVPVTHNLPQLLGGRKLLDGVVRLHDVGVVGAGKLIVYVFALVSTHFSALLQVVEEVTGVVLREEMKSIIWCHDVGQVACVIQKKIQACLA